MKLRDAIVEAARSRQAIASGSPPSFWVMRLEAAIERLRDCLMVLQAALDNARLVAEAPAKEEP